MSCTLEMQKERNARLSSGTEEHAKGTRVHEGVCISQNNRRPQDPSCLISTEAEETKSSTVVVERPTIVNGPDHVVVFIPGGSHKQTIRPALSPNRCRLGAAVRW